MKRYLTSILMLGSTGALVLFAYYFRRGVDDYMTCSVLATMPSAKEMSDQVGRDGYISLGLCILFAIAGTAMFITAVKFSRFYSKTINR